MSSPTIITSTVIFEPLPNYFPTGMSSGKPNAIGVAFQMPQCYISSNPYSNSATGTYGLLNCIAIQNTGVTAIIRFYQPPGGMGTILGFQNAQYPSSPAGFTYWLYIGANGYLYVNDYPVGGASIQLTPGWHTVVVSEYFSNGEIYTVLFLDTPSNNATHTSTASSGQLFGYNGPFPYDDIGTGYTLSDTPGAPGGWFFFNGAIDYIALYPGAVTTSQVEFLNYPTQSYNAIDKLPPGYVVLLTANSLTLTSWVDVVNGTSYYLVSGALQPGIFGQITQQGTTITNGPPPNQCWQPWGPVTCG